MITPIHAFSRSFPVLTVKGFSSTFLILAFPFFFLFEALALPEEDTLTQSVSLSTENLYTNYAKKGAYENETYFSEVPQWHYYDMFGNKILDGFYMYGLSQSRNTQNTGNDILAMHPLFLRWLNGLVQVADLHDEGGILAMIGDRVKSKFTPFSFNQSLFAGARFDFFYKENSLSLLTNRISNTGAYGAFTEMATGADSSDWLTGGHLNRKFGEVAEVGGTWVNIHHEKSKTYSNPYSGVDCDTGAKKTLTGLTLYGINADLTYPKLKANVEFLRSQEFLDANFKPKAGNVATFNGVYDLLEKMKLGSELYSIGSRFQTNFACPGHRIGDERIGDAMTGGSMGKYQYSLVEDNDDHDEFPENGRSRYYLYTPVPDQGDPDGTLPAAWDKDKNGIWDYQQNFLSYESDPPESRILFDRNSNGIADEVEDDAYPDYPYVPSYYLPGERYYRFDDVDGKWENKRADSLTHKGLAGLHLYTRYKINDNLELTVGGIFDRSQEKTFQSTYDTNGREMSEVYDAEKSTNLYFLLHYKKDFEGDRYLTVDNFFRKVADNIPNHTQTYTITPASTDPVVNNVAYSTVVDELDYRDMFGDALRAEFTLFKNRGFNYTGSGKFEFQKHFAHSEFKYLSQTLTSFNLINKCHYIYLLPFFKDMFLIPKFKNHIEIKGYGPTPDSANIAKFDAKYKRSAMTNSAYVVCEWKVTEKTSITGGMEMNRFNDLKNSEENYWEPCGSIQLMLKDRYAGMTVALTTGITRFAYIYGDRGDKHNRLNNTRLVTKNIDAHEFFINVHAGM
jgi:hypothetical protein